MKGICGAFIGFGVMLIVGIVFVGLSLGDLQDYFNSDDWAVSDGVVTYSEVIRSTDSDGDTTYRADVGYRFLVNEQEYTGDRVRFGGDIATSGRGGAQDTVSKYPVGREIKVLYNPDDPTENVLEREVTTSLWIFFGLGAVLLCAAFPVLGFGIVFGVLRR